MKTIITIVGARPQIIKAAAISRVIRSKFAQKITEKILHTGQHFDAEMSSDFFNELNIPKPNFHFKICSQTPAGQTGEMMAEIERVFLEEKPDAVIVYGDTTSTLAGAIVAAKMHIPLFHVEAGLRSFDKRMPEEINRILTDHCSDLLFVPSYLAKNNLLNEGISSDKIKQVGDVMYDNALYYCNKAFDLNIEKYILFTLHRPENVDDQKNLVAILEGMNVLAKEMNAVVYWPMHPRTKKMLNQFNLWNELTSNDAFKVVNPVGYVEMLHLQKNAAFVVSDSGGLVKEVYYQKNKTLVLRDSCEWMEIVNNGGARLCDKSKSEILRQSKTLLNKACDFPELYGSGNTAEIIMNEIIDFLEK